MTARPQRSMTAKEYLEFERSSIDIKHEYFDGEIFAMTGAKKNHNYINLNIAAALHNRLKANESPCKPASNDMRVKVESGYVYPDIVIHCGEAQFEDDELDTLINPVAIIEILSDSTEAFDRGKKFTSYRAIPTLQEYILVSQYTHHVEYYSRKENGKWEYYSYDKENEILKIEVADCQIPLSEIYWDINFEAQ